jgi:hypothetical protein
MANHRDEFKAQMEVAMKAGEQRLVRFRNQLNAT